ncbi:Flp pilus assembly protein CpaB [Ideonella sp.]|uniref:Flp pilus assembly protein CpaB n=1 Tax=Ideonella sp. TaxID=1929293 RepID=UPI002B49883B|nr:Flp pilus assembly protein CpaB [Ideonella sp.]HJV69439.1 Flp pilus assembly protein CpaB [Ideonella sp.]
MRSRGLLMLLIAAIAGLAAVALAARWMQQQGGKRSQVAVANVDIELGSRLSAEMVRMTEWPAGSIPAGAATDTEKLVGRVARDSLQRGEPILESRLAPVGTKGGLSAVVPEGKRAMTVRVNDVIGVAGFALPGTYVDVMVNTQSEGSKGNDKDRTISKIVLERILVLAVAQEADRDTTKPKVVNAVTLELSPGQAEMLDLARSVGTLSLVLRNQTEMKSVATAGITKADLLGMATPAMAVAPASAAAATPKPAPVRRVALAAPAPAPKSTNCVEVIRGVQRLTECF